MRMSLKQLHKSTYLTLPFDEDLPILVAVSDPWVPLLLLTLGSETFVPCNLIRVWCVCVCVHEHDGTGFTITI